MSDRETVGDFIYELMVHVGLHAVKNDNFEVLSILDAIFFHYTFNGNEIMKEGFVEASEKLNQLFIDNGLPDMRELIEEVKNNSKDIMLSRMEIMLDKLKVDK